MNALRHRTLCPREARPVETRRLGHLISESGGLGAEIVRHAMLIVGVVGLVAIASGALTDCSAYWSVLNWVSSCFYRG